MGQARRPAHHSLASNRAPNERARRFAWRTALLGSKFLPVAGIADKNSTVIAQAPHRRRFRRFALFLAAVLMAAGPDLALAQEAAPPESRPAEAAPKAADTSDAVAKRLGRLEEKLGDLQTMMGALESLVKAKPTAVLPQESAAGGQAPRVGGSDDLEARVQALETQIGALTSQLERMTQQLNAMAGGASGAPQALPPPPAEETAPGRQGAAPPPPSAPALAGAGGESDTRSFETTVSAAPEDGPPVEPPQEDNAAAPEPLPPMNSDAGASGPAEDQPQSLMAALPADNAATLYNQGYGDLLRRDYGAAQAAFAELVHSFPDDPLAGKAQYWLGETYYVRAQYKNAAEAFLKGYKRYKASEKAPDSLLKLGMALAALGQKEAACSAFGELGSKFPKAPDYLKDQTKSERRKTGC
jgi:tol-pal system protein YbgF